ncbi:MAG: SDR family oxidoreductase [Acidobacteria bacterium]|nr:SDR family oxidoreductase [Acidobacteriota bacterium]
MAGRILLTGATGYVGGRLLRLLEGRGGPLRCLARRPEFLRGRSGPATEIVAGDVLDAASLPRALEGVDTAYYLVHSMGAPGGFEDKDRQGARNFGGATREAGLRRIIYLGGLGDDADGLSAHLKSRHEVGDLLRAAGVPVIEFRASVILGSGSLSFEMIRALVERLPAMVTPRWVRVPAQPIAINDVLAYLLAALDLEQEGHAVFEIGGPEAVAYGDIMREYARQRGLRRLMVPVPLLTPRLSSLWLGLVTPVYARVGRKLIDGVRNPTLVRDRSALDRFAVRPVGVREAITQAIRNEDREYAETVWTGAVSATCEPRPWGGVRFGNRLVDRRSVRVGVPPARAFGPIERVGGKTGWYYADWLWRLRGGLDLLAGGVGLRRGRQRPKEPRTGETIDWWRIEDYEPGRRLRLLAEMKLPGRAWLEFTVEPQGPGSLITQTATFDPKGLWGLAYWYGVWPLHRLIFAGMLRGVARAAEFESGKEGRS